MEGYGVWTIVKGDEAKPNVTVGATRTQIQDWKR
jgi:GH24 family phage-related lysozyme (muramidase)